MVSKVSFFIMRLPFLFGVLQKLRNTFLEMASVVQMVERWLYLSLANNVSPLLGLKGYTVTRYIAGNIKSFDLLVSLQCTELTSGSDATINCRSKLCGTTDSVITVP